MVHDMRDQSGSGSDSGVTTALRRRIRELERERDEMLRRRRRTLLAGGVLLSLAIHICLMVYLNSVHRDVPGGGGPEEIRLEFAVLDEIELSERDDIVLDDAVPEEVAEVNDPLDDAVLTELTAEVTDFQLDSATEGLIEALGGSGDGIGGESGLSGGAAGTSFFGISGRGTRFVYIADVSGSMARYGRIGRLQRELIKSLQALPDYAHFHLLLFSSGVVRPPFQDGWSRASRNVVRRYVQWINQVAPGGGTQPRSSFVEAFAMNPRPDVIFFMTDGEISGFTAEEVTEMNSAGRTVVIHTIAFGDPTSQDLLRDIARQSGGEYRFVEGGGN